MAITLVSDSATISTTEYWLASDSTTKVDQTDDCVLQVWLDFAAMVAGDRYKIRVVEKVNAGTQANAILEIIVDGVQANLVIIPSLIVGDGWEVGVIRMAGSDRTIAWSLRKLT